MIQTDSDSDQSRVSVITESVPGVCSTCRNERYFLALVKTFALAGATERSVMFSHHDFCYTLFRILDFESTILIIRVHSTEQSAVDNANAFADQAHGTKSA